jgi:hypothetical protein
MALLLPALFSSSLWAAPAKAKKPAAPAKLRAIGATGWGVALPEGFALSQEDGSGFEAKKTWAVRVLRGGKYEADPHWFELKALGKDGGAQAASDAARQECAASGVASAEGKATRGGRLALRWTCGETTGSGGYGAQRFTEHFYLASSQLDFIRLTVVIQDPKEREEGVKVLDSAVVSLAPLAGASAKAKDEPATMPLLR